MNFVDVQPKSFLDYAWTSPSPAAINTAKPSTKTSRKQNRCCDQCRKGKRACDAAILEDTLLDTNKAGGNPTVFHYSDVFGPLASCGNCEKTKKSCTFEWLRSQRVLQAAQPQLSSAPPAKRRRTQSGCSDATQVKREVKKEAKGQTRDVRSDNQSDAKNARNFVPQPSPEELGITFADFPSGISAFDTGSMILFQTARSVSIDEYQLEADLGYSTELFDDDQAPINCDSGKGSSVELSPEGVDNRIESESPPTPSRHSVGTSTMPSKTNGAVKRISRKRRSRSPEPISNGALPCPPISFASNILLSTNNAFLTEGLLKIYNSSFENALACWLTERTCPYSANADMPTDNGVKSSPNWDRIYHHVFRLDRVAPSISGRRLTFFEEKAASKALNMSIYAFASQWAQSSQRSQGTYPFQSDDANGGSNVFSAGENVTNTVEFDRTLQISAWHEARNALQNAGDIESFRIVLAQIVFALTQKPVECDEGKREHNKDGDRHARGRPGVMRSEQELDASAHLEDQDSNECEDLLSKLNLAMDTDGPPVHLEKGLRLIHSLRSRMAMCGGKLRTKPQLSPCGKQHRPSAGRLQNADRATVDLLFWLAVMFDTLSAAVHKRPLVVSDEDSDVILNEGKRVPSSSSNGVEVASTDKSHSRWDDYLFARQQEQLQDAPTRWPCSFDRAATTLCDAAPVKVLLFRRITRIQTLVARSLRGEKVERSLKAALDVCDHWNRAYAPFIQDCIRNHDQLPPRVQSWYICLTGHWHLATLLLADLIEIVDESELGGEEEKSQRDLVEFVAGFRERNCQALSDLARCACPREDASFPQSREFHFAVNQGALLTEPWTVVLVRAFAKAGVVLLESEAMLPSCLGRADDCVKALWFLGRKSDMALSAAKILGDALKERREKAQEKGNARSTFLEGELWQGSQPVDGGFGVNCESGDDLLWDIIRDYEQVTPIAQLAEEHHKRSGRPFRIAVDEADWRFNNLTQAQVYAIRDASHEPAFQGIEKAMFYRICRLLTLNLQLVFVFDGPGRPWKRGKRGGGKIDYEKRRLLQQMLTCFGIPYHEAPGEAEAECARLQILGMVDAVWSQDSDCLMFGCTLWIHDHRVAKEKGNTDRSKENTKKNAKTVQLVGSRQMKESLGLDREGLVLFAVLVGGDYQMSGLPGCGLATAMRAVKAGLGHALCSCQSQSDCGIWSAQLADFLRTMPRAKSILVPRSFPDFKILQKYRDPKVSTNETLRNNSRLNLGYNRPIEELKLLDLTSSRFNIWGKTYMNWVGPILLTRSLSNRDSALPRELVYGIKLTKRRAKQADDQLALRSFERKLTFSPFGVTSLQRKDFEGDRLGYWNGDRATLFDPGHRVECELPDYWLQKTLPHEVLDPPPAGQKQKRQTNAREHDPEVSTTTKRKRKAKEGSQSTSRDLPSACLSAPAEPTQRAWTSTTTSKRRKQQTSLNRAHMIIELSESEDEDTLRLAPSPRSRAPRSIRSAISDVVDLGSPELTEDEDELSGLDRQPVEMPTRRNLPTDVLLFDTAGKKEDRHLQQAMQLSVLEQRPAVSPQYKPDRRCGRESFLGNVQRSFDTAATATHPDASVPAKTPRQQTEKALLQDPENTTRAASPHAIVPALVQPPHRSFPYIALGTPTSSAPTHPRTGSINPRQEAPEALPSSVTKLADIRAARLRHFVPLPATSTFTGSAKPTFWIPTGTDCIDLTDD